MKVGICPLNEYVANFTGTGVEFKFKIGIVFRVGQKVRWMDQMWIAQKEQITHVTLRQLQKGICGTNSTESPAMSIPGQPKCT